MTCRLKVLLKVNDKASQSQWQGSSQSKSMAGKAAYTHESECEWCVITDLPCSDDTELYTQRIQSLPQHYKCSHYRQVNGFGYKPFIFSHNLIVKITIYTHTIDKFKQITKILDGWFLSLLPCNWYLFLGLFSCI